MAIRSSVPAILVAAAAALLAGCGSNRSIMPPDAPRPAKQAEPEMRFNHEHRLAPEPGYRSPDIDALARQLSGIALPPQVRIVVVRQAVPVPVPQPARHWAASPRYVQTCVPDEQCGRRGSKYLNTLFWGGMGAVIGHQSGHTLEGAGIGAAAGHAIDHGGLHGLITPGTIIGAASGAIGGSFGGNAGKGALWGALTGHLLEDVFGTR